MSDYATTEEVRAWYASRGIPVSSTSLSKQHIAGWNKAHPDRPYETRRHGTSTMYTAFHCRCDECRAEVARRERGRYQAKTDGAA